MDRTPYLLHLADNALILGQRNAEWCGHGPVIEEDIALANMSLDLIGQARLLYQEVAKDRGHDCTEDSLAYFRDTAAFRNYTILELPHCSPVVGYGHAERDYGVTIVRNFLYSALMVLVWEALQQSKDKALAAIAEKSLKETRYHLRHSRDWLVRLGDGTEESHRRMQEAVDYLFSFTQEFWTRHPVEEEAVRAGIGVDVSGLRVDWDEIIDAGLLEARLQRPAEGGYVSQGKFGHHSEHLDYVLHEMQSLARAHPGATW
nr:1,2-phenylacetyl-CoA epoxidase, subunit C [Cupriavidus sp.]